MKQIEIDPKLQCYYCGVPLDICTANKMKHPTLCPQCFKDVKTAMAEGAKQRKL